MAEEITMKARSEELNQRNKDCVKGNLRTEHLVLNQKISL